MKKMLDFCFSRERTHESFNSYINLLFRCFTGLMMIPYGYGKIINYDRYAADFFGDPIGIGNVPSLWLTIFIQIICSITLILGFQTRISAFLLAFNMLIAVKFHFFDPFSVKALPILFLGMYIVQLLWGAGRYSLDHLLFSTGKTEGFSRNEILGLFCVALAFGILWLTLSNNFSGMLSCVLLIAPVLLFVSSYFLLKANK